MFNNNGKRNSVTQPPHVFSISFELLFNNFPNVYSNNFCCKLMRGNDWRRLGIAAPQELKRDWRGGHGTLFEYFEKV